MISRKAFRVAAGQILALVSILVLLQGCCCPLPYEAEQEFVLKEGDLLFQDLDGSPFYDAIEKVTQGYRGADLSHVGIAAFGERGEVIVWEAGERGVVATALGEFLSRSSDADGAPKVLVGRILEQHRHLIPNAIEQIAALKGKPYDAVFDIENDKYYCSELIYTGFKEANGGKEFFGLDPMTFVDPDTGKLFPVWQSYFKELGEPVPEGQPGLNPGGISRAPVLKIIYAYGNPDGYGN